MIHELPLERRTLHGHFSRDLPPVVTVDPGDAVVVSVPDAGWGIGPCRDETGERERFEPRDPELDDGHALIGPIEVRGAPAGQTLEVSIDEVRVGTWGVTDAGGWESPLNSRLGLTEERCTLVWELDAEAVVGRDQHGHEVDLRPFFGVIGMPPPEPGIHPTRPPRRWGGNIDCAELVAGTTLFLPIPVDGALVSLGDGHARQGDGEVSQLAIEAPVERGRVTLDVRGDLELSTPVARAPGAWLTFGFDEDLDEAMAIAVDAMLDLMGRELGVGRAEALALASVVVDLRVTQVVNDAQGIHAVLRDDALR